jgi:hypothetical protein
MEPDGRLREGKACTALALLEGFDAVGLEHFDRPADARVELACDRRRWGAFVNRPPEI